VNSFIILNYNFMFYNAYRIAGEVGGNPVLINSLHVPQFVRGTTQTGVAN
jgi:hypothetical protein